MANKLAGGIKAGSTGVSVPILLRNSTTGAELTGKVAADMTISYWRQGGLPVSVSPVDLAAVDTGYTSGGVKEVAAANLPGLYRLDLPDAAIAVGPDFVVVAVKVAGAYVFYNSYPLETKGAAEVDADVLLVKAKSDKLTFDASNRVSSTTPTATADIWSAALAEEYAAKGTVPTPAQLLFMIWSMVAEKQIAGVTLTAKKLDGTTGAMSFTLNDPVNPTTITRGA